MLKNNLKRKENASIQLDLLVISTACFTSINRNIYKLFVRDGYSFAIVVPRELEFNSVNKLADPPSEDDPSIIYLDLRGKNSRTNHYENLIEVIERENPRRILLDNEPISFMALKIGRWCSANSVAFFCFTYENLSLRISETYKRIGFKALPKAIVKRLLLLMSRKLVKGLFTINNEGTFIYKSESFKNVVKVPLGFDPEIFKINNVARSKIRQLNSINCLAIAFFGRVCHEKGVHILVNALSLLKQYNWVLIIDEFSVYKNEYNTTIHRLLEENGILSRVIFINPNHLEIADYMNAVDIVVIPSISTPKWVEQYGRVAAESMACGKHVIASNTGALSMLLNGHGTLFEEGNMLALSKILETFLISQCGNNTDLRKETSKYARNKLSINAQYKAMMSQFSIISPISGQLVKV